MWEGLARHSFHHAGTGWLPAVSASIESDFHHSPVKNKNKNNLESNWLYDLWLQINYNINDDILYDMLKDIT